MSLLGHRNEQLKFEKIVFFLLFLELLASHSLLETISWEVIQIFHIQMFASFVFQQKVDNF